MPRKSSRKSKRASRSGDKGNTRRSSAENMDENSRSHKLATGSMMHGRADELRNRLSKLDEEARTQLEEMVKKIETVEIETVAQLRKKTTDATEEALAELQRKYKEKIEKTQADLSEKQSEEIERIKREEETNADTTVEQKRREMENAIKEKERECEQDLSKFREKRETELEESIAKLRSQCEADIQEYTKKREQMLHEIIEQIRQKAKLELANTEQRERLDVTVKTEEIMKQFQARQCEEVGKLNQQLADEMAKTKERFDHEFEEKVREIKAATKDKWDVARRECEEKFRAEREELQRELGIVDRNIKAFMKNEQREIERRLKMKRELLEMLDMTDLTQITEEEFIETKYGCRISRTQMLSQNQRSSFYSASWRGSNGRLMPCVCKIVMKSHWSVRHQSDFAKHATKLSKYLGTQIYNKDKMIKNRKTGKYDLPLPFAKIYDVFVTDKKVYIFMELLENNRSLESFLGRGCERGSKRKSSTSSCGSLTRDEITNVLWQIGNGIHFLNRMFVAHANLMIDNVMVSGEGNLAYSRIILTGFTRPIVYYNVESDTLIQVKGLDFSCDTGLAEFYPPEAYNATYSPAGVDLYSFGVIAAYLVKNKSPYPRSLLDSAKKLIQLKQDECLTVEVPSAQGGNDLKDLIAGVTSPNIRDRYPSDEVIGHKFFQ